MAEQKTTTTDRILGFLRGNRNPFDLDKSVKEDPENLSRGIVHVIQTKSYHRGNLLKAIVALCNGPSGYRDTAWAIFQMEELPLSHLLEICDAVGKSGNTRRVRFPVAHKFAKSTEKEVLRAYFIAPEMFRKIFSRLYLPKTKCDDKDITNKVYKLAVDISTKSTTDVMKEQELTPMDLIKKLGVPLHMVMGMTQDAGEYEKIFKQSSSDDFMNHARNFKQVMGDDKYEKQALKKIETLKDPHAFLGIKKHLEETGAATPKMIEAMEARASEIFTEQMKNAKLEHVALAVDVSSSMTAAKDIASQLYEAFSVTKSIEQIVAFNDKAMDVTPKRLPSLPCSGSTSIGAPMVKIAKKGDKLDAIILITDLEETAAPRLSTTYDLLREIGTPPIIILKIGNSQNINPGTDYPNAIIGVDNFHKSLLKDIMSEVVRLTSKVAVKEKKVTQAVTQRNIVEETLGDVNLPERDPKTLKSGYMATVLCK